MLVGPWRVMSGEDVAPSGYQIGGYRDYARRESIMVLMLRIVDRRWLETVKDGVIKYFVIINVWYYGYAFVSILGISYAAANCMLSTRSPLIKVNMRVCKNQIML